MANKFFFSKNKPALGEAFKSEDAKEYLQRIFEDLHDAHTLKRFLTIGPVEYFNQEIKELKKHFYDLEHDTGNQFKDAAYLKVKRCIDGTIFKVGDKVIDKEDPKGRSLPIGRMYEDERGLHVRLDVEPDGKTITWRDLSRIEHDLPF